MMNIHLHYYPFTVSHSWDLYFASNHRLLSEGDMQRLTSSGRSTAFVFEPLGGGFLCRKPGPSGSFPRRCYTACCSSGA